MPWIDEATGGDARHVALHLRQADQMELQACGVDYEAALLQSFRSGPSWGLYAGEDEPFAVFGCSTRGIPWLLATDGLERHWRWFLRNTPEIVRLMQGDHLLIQNAVDTRNERHIRWLRWAGFKLGPIRTAPSGVPFQLFARRKPCASSVPPLS